MEITEYEKMYKFEENYWWWIGKREIIKDILDRTNLNPELILDVGCGTGFNLNYMKNYGNIIGIDFSTSALNFCKIRDNKNLVQASAEKLPFKRETFDLIFALDLLEHLDDNQTLQEFCTVLKKEKYLIVSVPAFEFLWSMHDEALHHKRRYDKGRLKEILKANNFEIEKIVYWNFFLFFPIYALRFINRFKKSDEIKTDVIELPDFINRFLIYILRLESRIISHGYNFPFGISILCICKSKKNE